VGGPTSDYWRKSLELWVATIVGLIIEDIKTERTTSFFIVFFEGGAEKYPRRGLIEVLKGLRRRVVYESYEAMFVIS